MPNLSVQVGADTSKLVQGINNAKQSLDKFITDMHNAAAAGEELTDVSEEQVQAYQKVIQGLEKATDGTKTAKQEQRALAKQIQELKDLWASLSNEARSSDFGKSMSETMSAAKEELASLKSSMSNMGDLKMPASSGGSIKKELRATQNELTSLTAQYRAMSAAERQSAGGQELARKMDELRKKAGVLKDTIVDVDNEVKVMASDTPNLDAFNQVLGIGADALSAYSSVIAKVTGDDKALKDAISTVMAVQSAANLATKVALALQSSSAIMLKTRAIQEGAAAVAIRIRTAAEGKGTVATRAATAAQAAFNVVAKANPYVILATAVIGAVSAYAYFTKETDKAAKEQEELNEAFKNQTQQLGQNIANVNKLSLEWKNLKSTADKTKWISDNKEEFKNLGIEINNLADAENVFSSNTGEVIKALELRAKAAAYAAIAADKYKKVIEGKEEADQAELSWYEGAFTQLKQWASGKYVQTFNQIEHSKRANMYREAEAEADRALEYLKKSQELEKEASETLSNAGIKESKNESKTTTKTNTKSAGKNDVVEKDSLSDLENRLSELKKKYKDGLIKITPEDYKRQVTDLEIQIVQKKRKMNIDVQFMPGSLQEMEDELSKFKDSYKKGFKVELDSKSFNRELRRMERAIRNKKIELGLTAEFTSEMQEDLEREIKEKEYELSVAVDDDSKKRISEELEKLLHLKADVDAVVGVKSKVEGILIDDTELAKTADRVNSEFQKRLEQKYDLIQFPPDPTRGLTKWRRKAENLLRSMEFYTPDINLGTDRPITNNHSVADQLAYEQSVVDSLQSAYDKYIYNLQETAKLTEEETRLVREYVEAKSDLEIAFENLNHVYIEVTANGEVLDDEMRQQMAIAEQTAAKVKALIPAYQQLIATKEGFNGVSDVDVAAIREYKVASANVQILTQKYKEASAQVYEFNRKAMISERTWDATKNGISIIGDLSSAAQNCGGAWKRLGDEWSHMTSFEKTTAIIDNTINSIESLIGMYEKIMDTIKLFGEISELTAAKKVAADAAVTASGEAVATADTANTAIEVANDQVGMQSKIASLGVDQAKSISGATASGASLPFPANIAAIAAGIAAVVAAFAMVFSTFAEGGIVGGGSYVGDNQIVRVNSGEMILNGTQQKKLFNLLNGTGSRNGNVVGQGGEVTFHIKGNDLVGVLTNVQKKVSKI